MKNRIIIIVLGFLLILCVGYILRKEYEDRKTDNRQTHLIESTGRNVVEKHYTRDSIVHTVFRDKIIADTEKEKALALSQSYIDTLQNALKMSINKMEQVSKINAELTAKLQLKEFVASNGIKALTHSDDYLKLNYYPHSDSVDFRYNLKLNEVRYGKRKWLLGKKHYYIDVFSDDPRVKINGMNTYRIRGQPPSRWGLGLHAGYGFQISPNATLTPTPIVGLGINYNLINL